MAKGKGKGKGKGKDGNNNPIAGACVCIIMMIILPAVLIIVGFSMFASENTRVERINKYNQDVQQWINTDSKLFNDGDFSVYDGSTLAMFHITQSSGSYWPVRDTCAKNGDPEEGCVAVPVSSYQTARTSPVSGTVDFYQKGNEFFSATISKTKTRTYTRTALDCSDTSTSSSSKSNSCRSKCDDKGGYWNGSTCTVTTYLSNVCYRVERLSNGLYGKLNEPSGCYYNDKTYSPFLYTSTFTSNINYEFRYKTDPAVIASQYTYGCSNTSPNSNSCFGLSRLEQNLIGGALIIVGILIYVGYVIAAAAIFFCCKQATKNCCGKSKFRSHNYDTSAPATSYPVGAPAPAATYPVATAAPVTSYPMATATNASSYPVTVNPVTANPVTAYHVNQNTYAAPTMPTYPANSNPVMPAYPTNNNPSIPAYPVPSNGNQTYYTGI